MPAPRAASREAAPFESAVTPQEFYGQISNEKLYAGKPLFCYEGPDYPTLLLLFQTPRSDIPSGGFLKSPVAEMLFRLFTSLNVAPESIGVTFFYKLPESRNFPPLVEAALRKMLTKELSLLDADSRLLFSLRFEEEMTVPQIAEVMKIPEGQDLLPGGCLRHDGRQAA